MSSLLCNKAFSEHHGYPIGELIPVEEWNELPKTILFNGKSDSICLHINNQGYLTTSYYVGIDWVTDHKVIFVEPKLNGEAHKTNFLKMLFDAFEHPEVVHVTDGLFQIKLDEPYIEIEQQHDLISPLLIIQFLNVVRQIVRKGLKKSYYTVEQNLNARIKGKVMVGQSIKQNIFKNKVLHNYCAYQEFGLNNLENRLLKKALCFAQHYLPAFNNLNDNHTFSNWFNYIIPAFETVSDQVEVNDIKQAKLNPFFKEYDEAIRLAKLILKRFGYNINNVQPHKKVKTPPFWIDMSKLFELFALGKLIDRFGSGVSYHFKTHYQELDFLINSNDFKMVADAKYKTIYKGHYDIENIRQLSGYARMKPVYKHLGLDFNQAIECLIIYPTTSSFDVVDFNTADLKELSIDPFVGFYKIPILIPMIPL